MRLAIHCFITVSSTTYIPEVTSNGVLTYNFPFRPRPLVERLPHVQRFGEAAKIKPLHHIANLKPRQPERNGHKVLRPRPSEAEKVTARLKDAVNLPPNGRPRNERIPRLAHEAAAPVVVVLAVKPLGEDLDDVRFLR